MTNIGKKQMNEEIAALARLKDNDIDTSDIAEIADWSQAIVGRFSRSEGRVIRGAPRQDAEDRTSMTPSREINRQENRLVHLPASTAFSSSGSFNYFTMSSQELVAGCLEGTTEAWQEFFHRYSRLITSAVIRVARRQGNTSPDVIDDLVQDVYVKLADNSFRLLRTFDPRHESAVLGYLKIIAANMASDHFRAQHAAKRGGSEEPQKEAFAVSALTRSNMPAQELEMFLEEVDQILKAKASERDSTIFWLYYRQGLTTKEIAEMPAFQLAVKGVESVLWRLTQFVRREVVEKHSEHSQQFPK